MIPFENFSKIFEDQIRKQLKLARPVCFFYLFYLQTSFYVTTVLTYYFGISSSLRLGSDNETNLLEDTFTYHSTETHCPLSRVHITLYDVPPSTQTFWMTIILNASPAYATTSSTKHFQKHDDIYEKSLKIGFWGWGLRLLLDVRIRIYQMFQSPTLNILTSNYQSSRKQRSGLRLASFLHQRVISNFNLKGSCPLYFLIYIYKSNVFTY